tara:strand:- start:498 stop:899 length:402 start_codon:yes stop_codon:yes gene_type:complete
MTKNILLASFIFPERIDWFIDYLENKFQIPKNKVFVFENLDDPSRLIVTFKFKISNERKTNFKSLFPNAILIHKKSDCIYTINALNRLIETEYDVSPGNTDYKSIKIDWDEYQNKIILINNNKLNISNIKRVF